MGSDSLRAAVTAQAPGRDAAWGLSFKSGTWVGIALVAALSVCILWSFLQPLLWAPVIAIASWPIYRRVAGHMPSSMASNVTPLLFTVLVSLVVLGPLVFAFGTLPVPARSWADSKGAG